MERVKSVELFSFRTKRNFSFRTERAEQKVLTYKKKLSHTVLTHWIRPQGVRVVCGMSLNETKEANAANTPKTMTKGCKMIIKWQDGVKCNRQRRLRQNRTQHDSADYNWMEGKHYKKNIKTKYKNADQITPQRYDSTTTTAMKSKTDEAHKLQQVQFTQTGPLRLWGRSQLKPKPKLNPAQPSKPNPQVFLMWSQDVLTLVVESLLWSLLCSKCKYRNTHTHTHTHT